MNKTNIIKFIFFINLFFAFNSLFAQNVNYNDYYKHTINAKILSSQGLVSSAIQEYDRAFSSAYAFPDDIIDAIKLHQKLKDEIKIKELLKLLVKCGYKTENNIPLYIEDNNQYFKYIKPTYISIPEYKEELDTIYKLYRKGYLENIDLEKDNYLSVFKSYEFIIAHTRKLASNETDDSKLIYLQDALWRSTKDFFLNLYNSGQDISRQNTDSWNDDLFVNCLIHSAQTTDYKNEEFQEFLLQMVKIGNLHPYQYAVIIDDIEKRLGNEQIYGTAIDPIEFDGDIEKYRNTQKQISKIKDIENVDKRRKEIFLPPLWTSAKKYNYKLPNNYKNK